MQVSVPAPLNQLVADPFHSERFSSFDAAIRATLLSPAVVDHIEEVERMMLNELDQMDAPVIHRFGPGIYIREITLPAGGFAIGNHHRHEQLNIMLKGRATVLNENGTLSELIAPMIFVGKPGRKVGYIHEEVVWQNVYATDETDIEKLEDAYVVKSENWYEDVAKRKRFVPIQVQADQMDYRCVLAEYGIPHELARSQSEYEGDRIPFPLGSYKVMVSDSVIEGKGMFATAAIDADERIAPARIDGKRTPAGRYTNHSGVPNAKFVLLDNGDLDLVAIRPISGCKGGRLGDEITIDYRHALELRKRLCHQQ